MVDPRPSGGTLIRSTHPWAWWLWAIATAAAVSLTSNPLFLLLLAAAVVFVMVWRRTDSPWARSLRVYFTLAGIVIAVRLVFQILLGTTHGGTIVVALPELDLPAWAAGIRIGGPVSAEALLYALYDAMRLATMLLCVGAANTLANPKRALRSVPGALYEISVAVTIALALAPQLIASTLRVRRARRLRGGAGSGWSAVRGVVIPVLEDAVERSLALATSMEVRGFGRTRAPSRDPWTAVALLGGGLVVTLGLYGFLTAEESLAGWLLIATGAVLIAVGLVRGGRGLGVTRYRPDLWGAPEWIVTAASAVTLACGVVIGQRYPAMVMISDTLAWPELDPFMLLAAVATASVGVLTPVPPHRALGGPR